MQRRAAQQQETEPAAPNVMQVRPPQQSPATTARRPPEPLRPNPARKPGVSLLSARARRRRFRDPLQPR